MKRMYCFFVVAFCLAISGGVFFAAERRRHAEPDADAHAEVTIARVYLKTERTTVSLLDLHRAASARLRKRYDGFAQYQMNVGKNAVPEVHVNTKNGEDLVTLIYVGKLGEPSWRVTFSSDGSVSDVSTGRSGDLNLDESSSRGK